MFFPDVFEPVAELGIAASVVDEDVDGVKDYVDGGVVGELFEEGVELEGGKLELVVPRDGVGVEGGDILDGGPTAMDVLAEGVEGTGDRPTK